MWFLASREVRHARGRFALFVALVALLAFLVFVMTGLATGLGEATVSGVRHLTSDTDLVAFAPHVDRSLGRSDVDVDRVAALEALPGVDGVVPVGQSMANLAAPGGQVLSVALVGLGPGADVAHVAPGSGAPAAAAGRSSRPGPGAEAPVVLDRSLRGDARTGDVVTVQPGGLRLRVEGFASLGSIQHAAVATTTLDTWQQVRFGSGATDGDRGRASAFLVHTDAGTDGRVADRLDAAGLDAVDPSTAVASTPGYAEETGTVNLIRGFLLAIAAVLVGTIFWVLTLQKEGPLAVLRATGVPSGTLLGAYALQVLATTIVGVGLGLVGVAAAARILPAGSFVLRPSDVAVAAGLLVGLALTASATSVKRLLSSDPLTSLGKL